MRAARIAGLGREPEPWYLPIVQIRPVARRERLASGVRVAVSTASPSL